jgi:hypothetical protein
VVNAASDSSWPAVAPVVQTLADGLLHRTPDRPARSSKSA